LKIDKQKIISFGLIFAVAVVTVIWFLGFWYISFEKDAHKKLYLEKQTTSQKIAWDSIVGTHKVGMSAYFETYIDRPDVKNILTIANSKDEKKKAQAREQLYTLLSPVYAKLQERNVKQLHFQDRENNSFLRFHQAHNFGDSLNATRASIVMANRYKKPVFGFETGRVVSGFRNVFPIFQGDEHIGSVELSQPFEALKRELRVTDIGRESMMAIKALEILPKLLEENKKNYTQALFGDSWVVEHTKEEVRPSEGFKKILTTVSQDKKFATLLEKNEPFSYEVESSNKKYAITVTPIVDVEGKYTAILLSSTHSSELEAIDTEFNTQLVYFSITLFVAAFAMFWLLNNRRALEIERRRLATISETMGEGMYVIGVDGRIKYINEAALLMLGLSFDECSGRIAHYLFHSHDKNNDSSLEKCQIYMVIKSSNKYEGVDYFRKKDGTIFAVDVISSPLVENEETVGSVTVFRDISERIALEKSLKELNKELENRVELEVAKRLESEVVFKVIFDNSPEGILIIGKDGRYKECNAAAAKMLEMDASDIIGKAPSSMSPDIQPESGFFSANAEKMFLQNAFDGAAQHFEWTHIAKDGSYRLIEVMLSVIVRVDKKELLVLWRDITELKKLQKDKEAAQALLIQQSKLAELGMMIGAIAHQWKQPLNAIWLMTQDLKMSYDYDEATPETMAKFKNEMGEQVKFMSQTIDDFKNFYKPSTSKTTFRLCVAIDSVLSLLAGQLAKDGIEVVREFDYSIYTEGFESEFKQVILNIVNNAKDALQEKQDGVRFVQISTYQEKGIAKVEISDNAGGVDEKLLIGEKIFEPYNTTKGDSGTGVGLSLSKTIIEKKMNGRLLVKNIEDGALFTIELIAAKAVSA
jgi:PAS domain S-box-containing protein